jgi:hypothetical protein
MKPRDLLSSRWTAVAVLAFACLTRFYMAGEWSLWRDEERSIFFSQRLDRTFSVSFPLFFVLLRGVYEITGVSVLAGRMTAAALGVLSIVLTYLIVARLLRREVGVLAAGFLTLSIGHLFWSQSIRYYILLLVFQLISVFLFVNGLERGRLRQLAAVSVFLALAVLSHLTAALLFPVFVAHILISVLRRERGGGYSWKGYAAFGAPFLLATLFLLSQYSAFAGRLSALITGPREADLSIFLVYKIVGYFGPPAVGLGLVAPFITSGVLSRRIVQFFVCLAVVPLLELVAVGWLGLAFPLWYQALIAGVGFAVLAAMTLYALRERGYVAVYRGGLAAAIVTSFPLLAGYYTVMHGDRPRWKETVAALEQALEQTPSPPTGRTIYSTNGDVVEFYLNRGEGDGASIPLRRALPWTPPTASPGELWLVVEFDETPPHYRPFLNEECTLVAEFESMTGPKNRTVAIYRREAPSPAHGPNGS